MFGKTQGAVATGLITAMVAASLISCASTPAKTVTTAEDPEAVRQEIEVGKAAFAKIAGEYGLFHDRDATTYVNLYLKSLALYSQRQGLEFSVGILNTSQINAYSLPGGYVLVTLGLLKQIDSPGELAGVFAHELGHINLRHILENVKVQLSTDFWETLARIIAGPRQVITTAMDQINQKVEERLFLEGFAAKDEFDADAYAVHLLQSLNASAEPYRQFLEKLGTEKGSADLANLDKTHPPISDRLAAMSTLITPGLPELKPTEDFTKFLQIIREAEVAQ